MMRRYGAMEIQGSGESFPRLRTLSPLSPGDTLSYWTGDLKRKKR